MVNQNQSNDVKKEMITKVVARAWKDPEFKKKLFDNPREALREMHVPIPEGKQVRIVEEGQKYAKDDHVITLVFPKQPADAHKLSEKELANLAGAGGISILTIGISW